MTGFKPLTEYSRPSNDGMLSGLATLTHTPSPMAFLNSILRRPKNERPFLLIVTGFPADDATVPVIAKKSLDEISVFHLSPKQTPIEEPKS